MLPVLTGQSVSVLQAIDESEDATLSSIYDRLKETRSWIKGASPSAKPRISTS